MKILIVLLIFTACLCRLEGSIFNEKIEKAEFLRKAGLYDASIDALNDLVRHFEKNYNAEPSKKKQTLQAILLNLAKAHFQNENYQKTIETLKSQLDNVDSLVLNLMAFNQLKQYEEVILATSKDLQKNDQVIFERGYANFHLKAMPLATKDFEFLLVSEFEDLGFLSRIYLARIYLNQLNIEMAEQLLEGLKSLASDHPLQNELAYLTGEIFFQKHDYEAAALAFERAIPKRSKNLIPWYNQVQHRLGWSYLKAALKDGPKNEHAFNFFEKAESSFKNMDENESFYLSLGCCYLSRAHELKEEGAYLKANELLLKPDCPLSNKAKAEIEILKAEATSSYSERDNFYKQLTFKKTRTSLFYAKILYLRGLNDFKEGQSLLSSKYEEAMATFGRAGLSLHESAKLLKNKDHEMYASSLKHEALSYVEQNQESSLSKAFSILEYLIQEKNNLKLAFDSNEIYYLQAIVLLKLKSIKDDNKYDALIESILKDSISIHYKNNYLDLNLKLLGTFYYKNNNFDKAKNTFFQLVEDCPKSPLVADALFNAALSLENLNANLDQIKNLRKRVFTEFPNSNLAAESYFLYYSYQDYIQGEPVAIKHCQTLDKLFPKSPFVLNAYYLLGMDSTRNRKTQEGKWISKRNLNKAIDYFQSFETTFDGLFEKKILDENINYFLNIRYLAVLERALAHLKIAEESQNPKKKIYLDYAETIFLQIIEDFKKPETSYVKYMQDLDPFPSFQEESSYWLGNSYAQGGKIEEAKKTFNEMLEKYASITTTKGYFLSKVWYELGALEMQEQNYTTALVFLKKAEDSAKGKILNSEQRLDLWIQQSLCCQGLKQFDQSILILSKVINDDSVSHQRVKAMFLRAEMYALQGRHELSRKQLEAIAKKGGEWASKAREKLEQE